MIYGTAGVGDSTELAFRMQNMLLAYSTELEQRLPFVGALVDFLLHVTWRHCVEHVPDIRGSQVVQCSFFIPAWSCLSGTTPSGCRAPTNTLAPASTRWLQRLGRRWSVAGYVESCRATWTKDRFELSP